MPEHTKPGGEYTEEERRERERRKEVNEALRKEEGESIRSVTGEQEPVPEGVRLNREERDNPSVTREKIIEEMETEDEWRENEEKKKE
ncbi:hypothetical protein [Desulfohalovibrio reitneri]|uniref:hypothetical protein n=1 Tax=Desulfohalovibrio reitneri TaxID=1307759 RepID=UPI0004A6F65A|nr:hypothetical protein [Desulfohalovibrio reitneri]